MKIHILTYLLIVASMNVYSQAETDGIAGGYVGGIVGGHIDESKQSPELKEQIKKFQKEQKANTETRIAGGYVGGIAGGYVGSSQGGIAGGYVGGYIDSNLANCKKEDDGKTISCPDGEYVKSTSTNNSLRFPIKNTESKQEVKIKKLKSSGSEQ